ncbi:MAG: peptidase M16 [Nitrospirae bacterium GWC2_46_6]|nr:MAG: peptidase M16 [Nitrospirae bacterium GWA2_46_11]OGW22020.1 MAG: peptidase M16 [Nitrospirae bacterium GWC2_46_6]OGW24557.1 MAG: peptidase M16 [Nitrospirae bacterium GWB2_47_37]HAK89229.1 insulinase family protein [Nitrospiraceae bacterium]HCL81043.1 insulinase family protein [Nitrospiraceae bacterium]
MRFFKNVLIIAFLFIPLASDASVKEYTLNNGLKALIIEDHKAPLATFQIWYKVGSRDESAGKTGISHLLEHMMFKGTRKYSSKEFSGIIKRNGGSDNAFTTKDYTMYFQTLSSDRIGISIELEADRMTNLLLDPKEVASEKNVVMEERRMRYDDDPQNLLYEEVIASAFKAHPYQWPVIGWMSDIESIEREDLLKHYKTYYSPDNALIIISGDVNPDEIIADIRKHFEGIPNIKKNAADRKTSEPEQKGERRIYLKKEAELPYILFAYHTPSFPHHDSFALEVLSAILSGGKSSILYRNIVREKQIALNAFADYNALTGDPFLFVLGATAAPQKESGDLEKALYEEIEKIKEAAPSEKEVQKAKNQIEASFVFAQDSGYSRALYTGMFAMLGDRRLMDRYLEGIKKVSPEDVQAAAKKYLSSDNKTVGILVPVKK